MNFLSRLFGTKSQPPRGQHVGREMVSLVALMPSWQERSVEEVRGEIDRLFPGEFLPAREAGNFVLDGPVPSASYTVQCTVLGYAGVYQIQNVPGPYKAFSDFLDHIVDPQLKELAAAQPFWMSVDRMHSYEGDVEAYRFVSAVLAQLAPIDTALLVHPSRYLVRPFTHEVRRLLAAGGEPFGNA